MSVVLPVRDGQDRIAQRVDCVLDLLDELISDPEGAEVVVVDDGSRDATPQILDDLKIDNARLRIVRHSRPRGMEAAGQTGLERATGDLVFIQESDADIRADDMRRLHEMSRDESVVAARAESKATSLSSELIRRLKSWGATTDRQLQGQQGTESKTSLQMIRRPHLQRLASPEGAKMDLHGETIRTSE
ncbi:MAG: glycosyltransferase family 2 protein [Planctomycetota bacterium]